MHLYTLDVADADAKPKQLTSGKWEITAAELSRDGKKFYITTHRGASGRAAALHAAGRRRRAHEDHDDDRLERGGGLAGRVDARPGVLVQQQAARGVRDAEHARAPRRSRSRRRRRRSGASFNWIDPKVITFKARDGVDVYAPPVHAGDDRRAARPVASGRGVRARRRLRAERAPLLGELLPRVHVPQPARVARLRRARRRLPRQLGLRPRLAHRDLPAHGRQGSRGHRRRREVPGRAGEGRSRSGSASTAAATAASSR